MCFSKLVEVIPFDDPNKFMDAISPRAALWGNQPYHWIFRGQYNGNWKLQPKGYRYEAWRPFDHICGGLSTLGYAYKQEIQNELNAVWWFAKESDKQGFQVPGFDHTWFGNEKLLKKFYDEIDEKIIKGNDFFPLSDWHPIFAMAQHYGIPTRLLDWSESAYVAAYFSSIEASREIYQKKLSPEINNIAVWSLNVNEMYNIPWPNDEKIIIVKAPWATNDNLRAQKGLFTLHECKNVDNERKNWPSHDEALENIIRKVKYEPKNKMIRCLQLKIDKAPILLKYLSQMDITASSLFPGYAGVVKHAEELKYMAPINQN